MTFVLVHGGGHSARCWEPTLPHLAAPAVAVDLPGRGARPRPLDQVRIVDWIDTVIEDIEALDTDVVLVGHSLAGITIPGVLARIPERVRHVVFISCAIVMPNSSLLDLLPDEIRAAAEGIPPSPTGSPSMPEMVMALQCEDMDEAQTRFTLDVIVPEAYWPLREKIDTSGFEQPVPRTWVKLLRDRTFPAEVQDEMAARAGCTKIVEIDSGHTVMISNPGQLAAVLNDIHELT
jgi:pimeloyl-ACP methyl ester carboxylesterase